MSASGIGVLASRGLRRARCVLIPLIVGAVAGGLAAVTPAMAATWTVQAGQTNGGATAADQFNAAVIGINTGDTIHWAWFSNPFGHIVTSFSQTGGVPDWQSPTLNGAGQTYDHTFAQRGTFTYYCSIHALRTDADPANIDASIALGKMVGKITVTPLSVGGVAISPDAGSLAPSARSSGSRWPMRSIVAAAGAAAVTLVVMAGWRRLRSRAGDAGR